MMAGSPLKARIFIEVKISEDIDEIAVVAVNIMQP